MQALSSFHFLSIAMLQCSFLNSINVAYRFIYAFLGVGIVTLLITCTGHIAAETSHNFCLSCVSTSNSVIPMHVMHLILDYAISVLLLNIFGKFIFGVRTALTANYVE